MANPITWKNITAPDFTGASEMMERAGQSFTGALDTLGETKDQFEKGRTDRNTQNFMAELSKYRTPEELAAAQESGAIDAMRQKFGGNGLINKEKTNSDAIRDTLTGLRETRVADREYQDSETRYGNREAREAYDVAIAEGRFDDAVAIRESTPFLDKGAMTQQQTKAEQAAAERNWIAEQRDNSRADRARAKQEREAKKANQELLSATHADITAPLAEGESYTTRKNQLNELMKTDQFKFMAPSERTAFKKSAQESLQFGEAIAKGDQAEIDKLLKPIERERNRNVFYAHRTREVDDGTMSQNILRDYSTEDEDTGLSTLLNDPNPDKRLAISQGVQAAINGRTPDGEVLLEGGIPESYVRMALDSVKGNDWKNWDKDFGKQLKKIVGSKAFLNDYEQYVNIDERYDAMRAKEEEGARNGEVSSKTTPQPLPGPDIPKPTNTTENNVVDLSGKFVEPGLSNGEGQTQPDPKAQSQPDTSQVPRPTIQQLEQGPNDPGTWESGFDKISRGLSNIPKAISNTLREQQYEAQVNTFEEMSSIIGKDSIGPNEKGRLSELLRTNPSMLQFMTSQQRNNMRNLFGEGMINQIMKQIE